MDQGFAIIVDIGKTLSKVSLWSAKGHMLARRARENAVVVTDGIRRLDVDGIGAFLRESLRELASSNVQYIVPVAHGAGVVALEGEALACAPIDYEQPLPPEMLAQYRQQRGGFDETGSPALPDGLNLGAQLHWLEQLHGEAMASATFLPWAQYWAWFLSGKAVSEVTSLGCHSDLWEPAKGDFSALAYQRGWAKRFAPITKASDVIGSLRADLAAETGLPSDVKILAGLHDSNAALLAARGFAEIADSEATVLSTGTWFIAMRSLGQSADATLVLSTMQEDRDCLINVDAFGVPVPSARFMGGREIELLIDGEAQQVDIAQDQPDLLAAVEHVVETGAMVLPTLAPGNGPHPDGQHRWINRPNDADARRAAVCIYAALVAGTSLNLIGAKQTLLVEGRFAKAQVFVRALASLHPDMAAFTADAHNEVSFGALRLVDPALRPKSRLQRVAPLPDNLSAYRKSWHNYIKINDSSEEKCL
ncbi:MAG: FGGY family carbohydrate kinase [Novosphingobium sp.]|nr:FGGY family carbohydrate kinase [Novosphingobium sp.]